MMSIQSKWTILILKGSDGGPKKVRLSPFVAEILVVFLIGLAIFSAYSGYRLYAMRSQFSMLSNLRKENRDQARQLAVLAKKVSSLDREVRELSAYNRHLSEVANITLKGREGIIGIGGGGGGINLLSVREPISEKMLARALHSHIKDLGDSVRIEEEISKRLLAGLERRRSIMAHTPSIWPLRGWLTSPFGWRVSPFTGKREFHEGVDIAARYGSPIYAPADGVVTFYGRNGGYGNFLIINHGFGLVTRYGHLKSVCVKVGQIVSRGQKIGYEGDSGRSTGPHLHYEVLVNGIHVNPKRYMLK